MLCFVVQKQQRKHYLLLILRLTAGPYPGRTLGRFGVQPTNVGPGRSLGLRPGRGRAGLWPGFMPARTHSLRYPTW